MSKVEFPPVELADDDGLLAVGGDLSVGTLIEAYIHGIFPWPLGKGVPLTWFSPDPRGILFYNDLHISRSLLKTIKQQRYHVLFNQNFETVIRECQKAPYRKGTWITDEIVEAYINLYHAGFAYSVEAYNQDGNLVGGLYGVKIKKFYSGESMFFKERDASKVALVTLMNYLHDREIEWLDTQMVSPVVKLLGGSEISREEFLKILRNKD